MSILNVNALNISEQLKLPNYTTIERDALVAETGLLIYNSTETWLIIKIFFVFLLSACHGFFINCFKQFYNKNNKYSDKFFRVINEVPTFLLIVIVLLVVFKPTF